MESRLAGMILENQILSGVMYVVGPAQSAWKPADIRRVDRGKGSVAPVADRVSDA